LAPEIITGQSHDYMVDWWSFGILIYELSFGVSPFRGPRRDATFDNILKKKLQFPTMEPPMSDECKDLLKSLLRKDPEDRLGHDAGAEDVKRHPWFHDIEWSLLANSKPPYIPGETPHKLPGEEVQKPPIMAPVEGF